jgi:REP element-mobilizing transposase RayT
VIVVARRAKNLIAATRRRVETRRWNFGKSAFADCATTFQSAGPTRGASPMPANTGSHAELYVHLVWSTWDRVPLLAGEVRDSAYRLLQDECRRMGVEVMAIGGVEDHVHLLVRMPAAVSTAAVVKQLKGATSHALNSGSGNRPFFRWQGGYGAFSVSRQHVERIRQYVLNQPEHHGRGRVADFLEP